MKYLNIANNKLIGTNVMSYSESGIDYPVLIIEVSDEVYNEYLINPNKYIYAEGKVILNPDYETKQKEEQKQQQIDELKQELDELDKKRIRAICEPSVKDETSGETWLEYYNKQIEEIRNKIIRLGE